MKKKRLCKCGNPDCKGIEIKRRPCRGCAEMGTSVFDLIPAFPPSPRPAKEPRR